MTNEELKQRLEEIASSIEELQEENKKLAVDYGAQAIIERMKENNCEAIYLRDAEDEDYFCTEDLWFSTDDGRVAAKVLKLIDGKLFVVYTTFEEWGNSYEGSWEYDDEETTVEVDEEVSKNLISQILPAFLDEDDALFTDFQEPA
ncbi:MAG: hypothetical protein NC402_04675 [Prevotella sp.]|nr:hypothetical protein [Prevotella sp.]MCM1140730.1 hypothetical protein [Muribaculum sp.]